MSNTTLIDSIKKLLFGDQYAVPEVATEPVKMFVDVPLEDGSTLKVDKIDTGGVVTLNDMPAPDGDHKLADGRTLRTSGGVILEVIDAIATEDMAKDTPVVSEEMKQMPVKMAAHEASVKTLQKENANLKEAVTQLLKFTEELNTKIEKFGEQSIAKPTEVVKAWDDMSLLERRRAKQN